MARDDACSHLGRAQADVGHVGQATLAGGTARAWQPRLVALAQQAHQFSAQGAARHGVDRTVDGLVRHAQRPRRQGLRCKTGRLVHLGQFARDLLRRPTTAQAIDDRAPQGRLRVRAQLAADRSSVTAALLAARLGNTGLVVAGQSGRLGLAAIDLPADRRAADAELARDRRAVELGLQQCLDRHPVSRRHVRIVGSHLGDTLQVGRCRTSNLRPARPLSGWVAIS